MGANGTRYQVVRPHLVDDPWGEAPTVPDLRVSTILPRQALRELERFVDELAGARPVEPRDWTTFLARARAHGEALLRRGMCPRGEVLRQIKLWAIEHQQDLWPQDLRP